LSHAINFHAQEFSTFTDDLFRLKSWLLSHGCTIVAMESTSVYWRPVHNVLEDTLQVILVNARYVKNVHRITKAVYHILRCHADEKGVSSPELVCRYCSALFLRDFLELKMTRPTRPVANRYSVVGVISGISWFINSMIDCREPEIKLASIEGTIIRRNALMSMMAFKIFCVKFFI